MKLYEGRKVVMFGKHQRRGTRVVLSVSVLAGPPETFRVHTQIRDAGASLKRV